MGRIWNFLKKHKKGAAVGTALAGLTVTVGEASVGCISRPIGASVGAAKFLHGNVGKYWHANEEYGHLKAELEKQRQLGSEIDFCRSDNSKSREEAANCDKLEIKLRDIKTGGIPVADRYKRETGFFDVFPDTRIVKEWPLTENNRIVVKSADEDILAERYATWEYTPLDKIPKFLKDAFLLREDRNYYSHNGVNWLGKVRAIWYSLARGKKLSGGSGITEQVAKDLLTNRGQIKPPRSFFQKIFVEMPLAMELDRNVGKDQVLEFYLNNAFFGDRSFGVSAASRSYFGKSLDELDGCQMLFLPILVNNPGRNAKNGGRRLQGAEYLAFVNSIHDDHLIDDTLYGQCTAKFSGCMRENSGNAKARDICLGKGAIELASDEKRRKDIFDHHTFRLIAKHFRGTYGLELEDLFVYQESPGFGLEIKTTINNVTQIDLRLAFEDYLADRRNGLRDKLNLGGVVLDEENRIIAIRGVSETGTWGDLNYAFESRVPKASTVKPFLYTFCIAKGICSPEKLYSDSRKGVKDAPKNHDKEYDRTMTISDAIATSNNVIAYKVCKLISQRGKSEDFIRFLRSLGFDVSAYERIKDCRNRALGGARSTALELAAASHIFIRDQDGNFNGDYLVPIVIEGVRLSDRLGKRDIFSPTVRYGWNVFLNDGFSKDADYSIEPVRSGLNNAVSRLIESGIIKGDYDADVFFKTGTNARTIKVKRKGVVTKVRETGPFLVSGGFDTDNHSYSMAFLAAAKKDILIGETYASHVLGPLVNRFVSAIAPVKPRTALPKLPAVASADEDLDKLCTSYEGGVVNGVINDLSQKIDLAYKVLENDDSDDDQIADAVESLSSNSNALEYLVGNIRSCAAYRSSNGSRNVDSFAYFKLSEGAGYVVLYKKEARTAGKNSNSVLDLKRDAVSAYEAVISSGASGDYVAKAEKALNNLKKED
ncbi:penicillin-binding protein [Candidatus Woesearchaeota archaeon]|nr:penicillin-binding protein [Candidatus Woesearchaeota archaeon]